MGETERDPREQAAYDVARLLVAYPALRRVVEIAATVGVPPGGARGARPPATGEPGPDRAVPARPAPRYLRARPA